jgi:hypothetical protein|eukprot:2046188-Prymnesium_polylepis.1
MPFSSSELRSLNNAELASSSISLMGALLMIVVLTRQLQRPVDHTVSLLERWLLVIAVCDATNCVFGYLFVSGVLRAVAMSNDNDWVCQFQGFCLTFFPTLCNYATFWFSLHFWRKRLALVSRVASSVDNHMSFSVSAFRCQLFVTAAISLTVSVIPLTNTSFAKYELLASYCWIGYEYSAARQLLFYVHIYLISLCIAVFCGHSFAIYVQSDRAVAKLQAGTPGVASRNISGRARHFLRYPIGFLIIWAPGVFNRLWELDHGANHATVMWQTISAPSQGLVGAAAHHLHSNVHLTLTLTYTLIVAPVHHVRTCMPAVARSPLRPRIAGEFPHLCDTRKLCRRDWAALQIDVAQLLVHVVVR